MRAELLRRGRIDLTPDPVRSGHDAAGGLIRRLLATCGTEDLYHRFGGRIPLPEQVDWLLPRRPEDVALLLVSDSEPCAVVNLNTRADRVWEIALLVAPAWQGLGVARQIVPAAVRLVAPGASIVGQIHEGNRPALRLLCTIFPEAMTTRHDDVVEFKVTIVAMSQDSEPR